MCIKCNVKKENDCSLQWKVDFKLDSVFWGVMIMTHLKLKNGPELVTVQIYCVFILNLLLR